MSDATLHPANSSENSSADGGRLASRIERLLTSIAALISLYFPFSFFPVRNHGFRYRPSQYSSLPLCNLSRSISTTTGTSALGTGNPRTCYALCSIVLMTWGGATSRRTFPQCEKSNARAFSLLYNISSNTALSWGVSSFPMISFAARSLVSLDPFCMFENLGISQSEYTPFSSHTTSVSFDFATQSRTPPGLLPSDTPRSTGCTLSAFFLYAV